MLPPETAQRLRDVQDAVERAIDGGASPRGVLSRVTAALLGDSGAVYRPVTVAVGEKVVEAYAAATYHQARPLAGVLSKIEMVLEDQQAGNPEASL